MTTIRDETNDLAFRCRCLEALGIDPDLPAEWATVDRCLTWLRERHECPLRINVPPGGAATVWLRSPGPHYGRTLHAALIAACKAVQEATP